MWQSGPPPLGAVPGGGPAGAQRRRVHGGGLREHLAGGGQQEEGAGLEDGAVRVSMRNGWSVGRLGGWDGMGWNEKEWFGLMVWNQCQHASLRGLTVRAGGVCDIENKP